jgi:hypothetical protein
MDEITFTLNGREYRLTRQQVVDRMRAEEPESIQQWAAEVEGRWFPVKQALSTATGAKRADFISHRARDILRRLDFRVVDVQEEGGLPPAESEIAEPRPEVQPGAGSFSVRLAVLPLAVQYMSGRADSKAEDVLKVAEAFEAWVTR